MINDFQKAMDSRHAAKNLIRTKLSPLKRYSLLATALGALLYAEQGKIDMHGGKDTAQNVQIFYGKVLEIKSAQRYKYLKVDEGGKEIWVAIADAPVSIGDKIGYDKKTIMKNFKSEALDKEFAEIIFASKVQLPQKKIQTLGGMIKSTAKTTTNDNIDDQSTSSESFSKQDTYTIEEIYRWKDKLSNQTVAIKGNITKVSKNIMNKDWIHLVDGTGNKADKNNDLILTAASTDIKVGDVVIAKGKLAIDQDIGSGYFYKVIIEDAEFSKQ
ncbi:MAG: hypothetical protein HF962_07595 [Sulfurovum sp.]|nr:hypothetical protein [Sulfurovum sp.]